MPKSSWEFLTGGKVDAEQQEKKEEVRLARERLAEFGTSKSCPWRPDEITTITNSLAHLTKQKERLTRTTRRCKPCSSKCENTSRRSCAHQGWTTQNRRATRPTKSSTNDAGSTSRKSKTKNANQLLLMGFFVRSVTDVVLLRRTVVVHPQHQSQFTRPAHTLALWIWKYSTTGVHLFTNVF